MLKIFYLSLFISTTALAQQVHPTPIPIHRLIQAGPTVVSPSQLPGADPGAVTVSAPDPESDVITELKTVHDLAMNKEWGKLLFVGVTLLVWALRKFLGNQVPFIKSKLGGISMSFFVAFSGMLATEWPAGTHPSMHAVVRALEFGFLGMGGWTFLKNLLEHFALGTGKVAAFCKKVLSLLGEGSLPTSDPLANDPPPAVPPTTPTPPAAK